MAVIEYSFILIHVIFLFCGGGYPTALSEKWPVIQWKLNTYDLQNDPLLFISLLLWFYSKSSGADFQTRTFKKNVFLSLLYDIISKIWYASDVFLRCSFVE